MILFVKYQRKMERNMSEKLTVEEIKKRYPNEWVKLIDFEKDEYGYITKGVVSHHKRNKHEFINEVLEMMKENGNKPTAQL